MMSGHGRPHACDCPVAEPPLPSAHFDVYLMQVAKGGFPRARGVRCGHMHVWWQLACVWDRLHV